MSYSDLLKGRCFEQNRAYFITTVTFQRKQIFNDLYSARELVKCIRNIHEAENAISLSWVIMPDHFHRLVQLHNESLSSVLNKLKGFSSRNINKRLGCQGPIWQKSYYDRAVRDNEDIKNIARYIVANPLRSGLVSRVEDYSHWDAIWM